MEAMDKNERLRMKNIKNLCVCGIVGVVSFVLGRVYKDVMVSVNVHEANKGTEWAKKNLENYRKLGQTLEEIL